MGAFRGRLYTPLEYSDVTITLFWTDFKWPHHQYIHRSGQKTTYLWIYHGTHWTLCYRWKLYHTEKQGFGYTWLSKKFQTHPPKPAKAEPSFRKVSLPPAKLRMLFPLTSEVRESWPQIFSLWQALDWGLLSKILASMKMGGAGRGIGLLQWIFMPHRLYV